MDLIYWSVRSSSKRGGNGLNEGYRYFSQLLISHEYGNLVQHPYNNISLGNALKSKQYRMGNLYPKRFGRTDIYITYR